MKRVGLVFISTVMMLFLVACGNEMSQNDGQVSNADVSSEVDVENKDSELNGFEEVVLLSEEEYTVSVVNMERRTEMSTAYYITIAIENNTNTVLELDINEVAVNNIICDFNWSDYTIQVGEKATNELRISESDLEDIGITGDILKVNMYIVINTVDENDDVNGHIFMNDLIYYPQGEENVSDISAGIEAKGTVLYDDEYCTIYYDGWSEMSGITLFSLYIQNKTDELIRVVDADSYDWEAVSTINGVDYTGIMIGTTVFPNSTNAEEIGIWPNDLENLGISSIENMNVEFAIIDAEREKLSAGSFEIIVE